mmetsp:Transcript_66897/g.186781  ORF Transcript_66897/g.186781 Transcript_66897/m.186781 type:complete len:245 (-) Transcript_66897:89-823(-)
MPQTRGPLSSSSGEVVEAVRYRRHRSRRHGGHPPLTPLRESSSLAPRDTENRRSWDFDDDQQGSCTGRRPAPVEGSECSFHAPRTPSDAAWQPTPSLTPRSPARPRAEHSAERTPSAQNATLLPAPALPSRPRIVHEVGILPPTSAEAATFGFGFPAATKKLPPCAAAMPLREAPELPPSERFKSTYSASFSPRPGANAGDTANDENAVCNFSGPKHCFPLRYVPAESRYARNQLLGWHVRRAM